MKKIVCFLLLAALLVGCVSTASASLSAYYKDGKIYVSNSGSGITRSIGVAGNTDTVLEISFKNTSGAVCGSFTVDAGSSMISLSALGLASGETLHIDHTVDGLLRIRVQSSSGSYRIVLDKRTPESSDDLWVPPGTATVSVTAQRTGTLTLSCAGRYT